MTTKPIQERRHPMKGPTLLPLIDPKISPKYSPNLYAYIRKNFRDSNFDVIVTKPMENGYKYVGTLRHNGCFSGSRLNSVLCNGAKETVWAIGQQGLEVDGDFWSQYIANGRCAIDPKHETHFIGSETRWLALSDDKRQCLWCGNCTQVNRKWVVQIQRSRWENENKGSAQ